MIANPPAAPLFFRLLQRADPQERVWGIAAWQELLQQGTANLVASDHAGLNALLIAWFAGAGAEPELRRRLLGLLGTTASFSISGGDLRALLRLLSEDGGGRLPPFHADLLGVLGRMAAHEGPSSFFSFPVTHLDVSAGVLFRAGGCSG